MRQLPTAFYSSMHIQIILWLSQVFIPRIVMEEALMWSVPRMSFFLVERMAMKTAKTAFVLAPLALATTSNGPI